MHAAAVAFGAPAIPNVPGTQLTPVHDTLPAAAHEPGGQAEQPEGTIEPTSPVNPAGQGVPLHETAWPALYWPGPHC